MEHKYDPHRFNAAIFKVLDPKFTALVFASGKITLCGCRSETILCQASNIMADFFTSIGYECSPSLVLQNVVAVFTYPHRLDLIKLHSFSPTNFSLEPELFPGLIYRHPTSSFRVMIFISGKMIITGIKQTSLISNIIHSLMPYLDCSIRCAVT